MKLIAKKPCSFCGNKYYIGDEIPKDLVTDPNKQERLGVITIVNTDDGKSGERVPAGQSGTLFTQDQVDSMIADAVEAATAEIQKNLAELHEAGTTYVEMSDTASRAYEDTIMITVDGKNEQSIAVLATADEISAVFTIMQMSVDDGAKAIERVKSENVLILLHAADSRKGIKTAAKERAGQLSSTEGVSNESTGGNEFTDTVPEGADT